MFTNSNHQFAGVFDGNNHKITVTIEGTDHVAAFGYLGSTGIIEDVEVHGTVTGTSAAKVSGLVSTCYGEVRNCKNYATITSVSNEVGGLVGYLCIDGAIYESENYGVVSGADRVGGIAGYAGGGSIINGCHNKGTITGTKSIGGILGIASKSGQITNNVNKGNVKGNVTSFTLNCGVGGIVGSAVEGSASVCTISKNINEGKVENEGLCTGGIVGIIRGTWTFENCTNNGEIFANGSLVGGIVGVTDIDGNVISNCENNGSVTGATYVGGIIGSLGFIKNRTGCKVINCTNNGDIEATATESTIVDGDSSTDDAKPGSRVGGIAGMVYGSTVEKCTNSGNVIYPNGNATKNYQTTKPYAGLLVGYKTTNGKVIVE